MTDPNPMAGPLRSDAPPVDAQLALAEIQLRQLGALRDIGFRMARDLEDDTPGDDGKRPSKKTRVADFDRITRAIRQIMALEQETIGLREKRIRVVRDEQLKTKAKAIRRSVEHSLVKAKPEMERPRRERLLSDLFRDYGDYANGNVRDIVADICRTLGVTADLSLWDAPRPDDIVLPAGPKWIVPANGEKPYTVIKTEVGRKQLVFDSPHIAELCTDPPNSG